MLVTGLVFALLVTATWTDLARRKIYNWLTYPGILGGLAINAAGSLRENSFTQPALSDPASAVAAWQRRIGWVGIVDSGEGLLLCGGIMLLCYVFFRIGGGDVKMMAMLGTLLGVERGVETLLWTLVLSAALALIVLVWRVGAWQLLARTLRQVVWTLRIGSWSPLSPDERRQLQVPLYLAPSALAGFVVMGASRYWHWV